MGGVSSVNTANSTVSSDEITFEEDSSISSVSSISSMLEITSSATVFSSTSIPLFKLEKFWISSVSLKLGITSSSSGLAAVTVAEELLCEASKRVLIT